EEAEERPLALALLAAAAAPAAMAALAIMVFVSVDLAERALVAFYTFWVASAVAGLFAIFLGLPAYTLLHLANKLSAGSAVAAGFCIAFAPVALLATSDMGGLLAPLALIAGCFGAVGGAAFWVVHAHA